jgi:hypothetical protein
MPVHTHQFRPFVRPPHMRVSMPLEESCNGWGHSLSEASRVVKKSFSGSGGLLRPGELNSCLVQLANDAGACVSATADWASLTCRPDLRSFRSDSVFQTYFICSERSDAMSMEKRYFTSDLSSRS